MFVFVVIKFALRDFSIGVENPAIMKIAILCVVFLAILQILLGLVISGMRRKFRCSVGAPDDPNHPLFRARLAFSNCAEWHPIFFALLLVLPMGGAPKWSIWLSPAVVAARYLMVAGLVTFPPNKPNIVRVLGAVGTYLTALLLSGLVIATYWPTPAQI